MSLRPVDMVGAGIVLVGLVVVAGAAGKEKDTVPGGDFMPVLIAVAAVLIVAVAACYTWAPAWLMAVLSGLGFSLVAIGARSAETDGTLLGAILHPVALVVLGGGAVGVVGNIRALEKGSVAIAASIVSLLEVVIPSAVGITLLGDTVRPGWDIALVVAIAVALGGCGLLAASPANKAAGG